MNRCVNIDWMQVYCLEPFPYNLDAEYFRQKGYTVKVRDYGTPQYREMFTIYERQGFPFIEIRRNPYSLKRQGGIFEHNACHLRLSNRACYTESPIDDLRNFLIAHNYTYVSISRIDICLDFNFFDFGDKPEKILKDYMEGKYSKINQCNIGAHGKDRWAGRLWNSMSWGSHNSMISTKMYNKTLELNETHDKFYIRDAWTQSGLRTDIDVWRVEFSIKSDMKGLVKLDTGEFIDNTLNNYDNRNKLLFRFHSLADKYFHFKYVEYQDNGKLRRKDRCRDKVLFIISSKESAYKPARLTTQKEPNRTDKILCNRLYQLADDFNLSTSDRDAIIKIIEFFHRNMRMPIFNERLSNLILSHET